MTIVGLYPSTLPPHTHRPFSPCVRVCVCRFYKKAAAFVLRAVAKHSPDLAQAVVDSGALDALVPCLEVRRGMHPCAPRCSAAQIPLVQKRVPLNTQARAAVIKHALVFISEYYSFRLSTRIYWMTCQAVTKYSRSSVKAVAGCGLSWCPSFQNV